MLSVRPTLADLFTQLGLESDQQSIQTFIENHKGLSDTTYLYQAPYWNDAQSAFLKDSILEDANWAEVIDELNVRLH